MPTLKLYRGQTVRLRNDIHTRGGIRFRRGLQMKVACHEGGVSLYVWVRGSRHMVLLKKKNVGYYLEADDGHRAGTGDD